MARNGLFGSYEKCWYGKMFVEFFLFNRERLRWPESPETMEHSNGASKHQVPFYCFDDGVRGVKNVGEFGGELIVVYLYFFSVGGDGRHRQLPQHSLQSDAGRRMPLSEEGHDQRHPRRPQVSFPTDPRFLYRLSLKPLPPFWKMKNLASFGAKRLRQVAFSNCWRCFFDQNWPKMWNLESDSIAVSTPGHESKFQGACAWMSLVNWG